MQITPTLLAPNFQRIDVDDVTVWFSYSTPIAFRKRGEVTVARQNDWSVTTGKHLNEAAGRDKSTRLPAAEFLAALAAVGITSEA